MRTLVYKDGASSFIPGQNMLIVIQVLHKEWATAGDEEGKGQLSQLRGVIEFRNVCRVP